MSVKVGISDTYNEEDYSKYVEWMLSVDNAVKAERLSYRLDKATALEDVQGLLLTGGGDVHPRFYEKENKLSKAVRVDEKRDEFEFGLIENALDAEIPILGVCRGMQVMNVYLGGTLIADLESEGYGRHRAGPGEKCMHKVSLLPDSMLYALTGKEEIDVNSIHHQAVGRLGKGMMRASVSDDGVTEGAEWALKDNMPFLLLVQWHPERIPEDAVSKKIAHMFLREAYEYR